MMHRVSVQTKKKVVKGSTLRNTFPTQNSIDYHNPFQPSADASVNMTLPNWHSSECMKMYYKVSLKLLLM